MQLQAKRIIVNHNQHRRAGEDLFPADMVSKGCKL
jgi:hypothetical protein